MTATPNDSVESWIICEMVESYATAPVRFGNPISHPRADYWPLSVLNCKSQTCVPNIFSWFTKFRVSVFKFVFVMQIGELKFGGAAGSGVRAFWGPVN